MIKCDNEECVIDKNSSTLKIFDQQIDLKEFISKYNSIKVNFGPEHLLRIRKSEEGEIKIFDCSNYYTENVTYDVIINMEHKHKGIMCSYVYKIILFCLIVVVLQSVIYYGGDMYVKIF